MPTFVTKIRKPNGETEEQLLTVPQENQLTEYLSRIDGFVVDCVPYNDQTLEARRPDPTLTIQTPIDKPKDLQKLRSKPQDVVDAEGRRVGLEPPDLVVFASCRALAEDILSHLS